MLPWILGCGGCGALIVLALLFFGVIGYFAESAERAGAVEGDTTVVVDTSVVGTDSFEVNTTDGGSFDGTTDDTSTPADDSQPADGTGEGEDTGEGTGEGEIKEIKPLNP